MLAEIDLAPVQGLLNLDQYFGLWAVEGARFTTMLEQVAGMDLAAHVQLNAAANVSAARTEQVVVKDPNASTIAVIQISGMMTKQGSSLSGAGSTVRIRQAVRAAARDEAIGGILIKIDSPGGTVAGTADLAAEVAAAAAKKPVYAFVEDLTASAAYWVASQADKVFANQGTAWIGSIGTFYALYDFSGWAAKEGIRAVVIRSGEFKGAGFEGTKITEEQEAYWQGLVDKVQAQFSAGVSAGRKLTAAKVADLADGRVHVAADAKRLGLIDGVQSFEETIRQLSSESISNSKKSNSTGKAQHMSNENGQAAGDLPEVTSLEPQIASYQDLVAACEGADNDFICGQLDKKATVDQAKAAWMKTQSDRLAASQKQLEEAQAAAAKKPGVESLEAGGGEGGSSSFDGDAVATFKERTAEKVRAGMDRRRAIMAVARADPELHQAFLLATNPNRSKVQSLIRERFELNE